MEYTALRRTLLDRVARGEGKLPLEKARARGFEIVPVVIDPDTGAVAAGRKFHVYHQEVAEAAGFSSTDYQPSWGIIPIRKENEIGEKGGEKPKLMYISGERRVGNRYVFGHAETRRYRLVC